MNTVFWNIFKLRFEVFRYLLVGGCVFLIYFALIYISVDLIGMRYALGVSVSYVLAVGFHFYLNSRYTFSKSVGNVRLQVFKYIVLLVVNYVITICVVTLCVEFFLLSKFVAAALGVVSTTLIGFVAAKFWIFSGKGVLTHE